MKTLLEVNLSPKTAGNSCSKNSTNSRLSIIDDFSLFPDDALISSLRTGRRIGRLKRADQKIYHHEEILHTVSHVTKFSIPSMVSGSSKNNLVVAKRIYIVLAYYYTPTGIREICYRVSLHHTNIYHGIKAIKNDYQTNAYNCRDFMDKVCLLLGVNPSHIVGKSGSGN